MSTPPDVNAVLLEACIAIVQFLPKTTSSEVTMNEWTDGAPDEAGYYWHEDSAAHLWIRRVFVRPGHAYLCVEDEPYGPAQKRNFVAVQKMGGRWSNRIIPPIDA